MRINPRAYYIGLNTLEVELCLGDHNDYPRTFHSSDRLNFPECQGMPLHEYSILISGRANPWVPGVRSKIPHRSSVRDAFASISESEAAFCGAVEKDEN